MNLTEDFRLSEYVCSAAKTGVFPSITEIPPAVIANAHKHAALLLQPARDSLQKRIKVTSGWRTPEHNLEVGGARRSEHLTCSAADVQAFGDDGLDIEGTHTLFMFLKERGHFGQLIFYDHRLSEDDPQKLWVHVSLPTARHPGLPGDVFLSTEKGRFEKWEGWA